MRRTYVIAPDYRSPFLPEGHRGAARIAHDGELSSGPLGPGLDDLGAQPRGSFGRSGQVVDLHVRNPALHAFLAGSDRGERRRASPQHRHAGRTVGALPAEKLLVEPGGLVRVAARVVEPHETH